MTEVKHGTASGYNYRKCRCEECREWKRLDSARYYAENGEKVRAAARRYYAENADKVQAVQKSYQERNQERLRAYQAQYLKDNAEQVNRKNREWRRRNRRKVWASSWLDRHRLRGGGVDDETKLWIKSLTDGIPCTYCGEPFDTIDHIIPIAAGGTNMRENLTPACNRCNRRKQHMSVEAFLIRLREES